MTTLIVATDIPAVSAAFAMAGDGKIIAKLTGTETVTLQEELPDGTYVDVVDDRGIGIVLSAGQKSRLFTGYGNYKVVKTATAAAVAVGLES